MKFQINKKIFFCPMELTMDVLGGKWKLLILWQLQQGTKRYGELRTALQNITHKMLTQQLRELESDGIVHREVFHVVPPKVEYSLTERGNKLTTVMESMAEWASAFQVEEAATPSIKKKTSESSQTKKTKESTQGKSSKKAA